MASGPGADAHSDGSADSVELPPGMLSECPDYPRSIDADLKRDGTVAKSPYSYHPFATMPGRDDGELPDHIGAVGRVCEFAVVRNDGRATIAAARTTNFVMTKSGAGVGGLLLCE
jgi:hypothetical protein